MPKVRSNQKLNNYVTEFGSDVFSTDGIVLLCKLCGKGVNGEKKYFVQQHLGTAKHKSAVESKTTTSTSLISTHPAVSSRQNEFYRDLCEAFVSAGIPLWKLENKPLKSFLEKYTKQSIPSESTLRKSYIDDCYNAVVSRIRSEIDSKNIWISIDETTDAVGRYIANVIIGDLDAGQPSKIYLLTSEQLEKVNGSTIAQLFTNALSLLWPDGLKHERVLLFITDAAPYMKKAGKAMKVLFPSMLHLTCLAHALHRVSEEIRSLFPDVDQLVSNGKKIFLKSPSRISIFKELAPHLPLPPQPILTRWGTWISAVIYYAQNYDAILNVVEKLDEDDAAAIGIVKRLLRKSSLRNDLSYVFAHFSTIPACITSMETRNKPLVTAVKEFNSVVQQLGVAPGKNGMAVHKKCQNVIAANGDLQTLRNIASVLEGKRMDGDSDTYLDPTTVASFMYAPITSVDVERSFSTLKHILSDRRQSMTPDNLKKMLVIMCNNTNK